MKGFSLLEMILSLCIMTLIAVFSFHFFDQKPLLKTAINEVAIFIQKGIGEARALNQDLELQFSTSSGKHVLTLYDSQNYSNLAVLTLNDDISLSINPTIDALNLSPFSPILSASYYGYPASISQKVTLTLNDHRNESKTIDIYKQSGSIDYD